MKILLVNWSWYPTGGDWTYVQNIRKIYELHGHEVIPFSTSNDKNLPSPYSGYFVNSYDFKQLNRRKSLGNGIKAVKTSVVSRDAVKKLNLLLDNYDIKVAHLHNIHHYITPAIVEVLSKRKIRILWTLHDYKIICPENSFVSNGRICEKCINGSFYHCFLQKCKKNSFLASGLAAFEAYYYHKKNVYSLVDYFLCPSNFLQQKFIEAGIKKSKLVETNLCYDISLIDDYLKNQKTKIQKKEKYILYIGRLEKIKGINTLIKAVKGTDIVLKIAGTGSEEQNLKNLMNEQQSNNIELLGFKNREEVFELISKSCFGVCPSEWYENLPYSVAEVLLFSKPVVGSDIGGIPELIKHRTTGLLFKAGDATDLREKLLEMWNNEELVTELGKNGRLHAYDLYNFETHWTKMQALLN